MRVTRRWGIGGAGTCSPGCLGWRAWSAWSDSGGGAFVVAKTWNRACCVGFFFRGRVGCRGFSSGGAFRHECRGIVGVCRFVFTKVGFDGFLKVGKDRVVHGELPVQIVTHLPLHLIHLTEAKHALSNNTPRLV